MTKLMGAALAAAFVVLGLVVRTQPSPADRWVLAHVSVPDGAWERVAQAVSALAVLCSLAVLVAVTVKAWWRRDGWPRGVVWAMALLLACGGLVLLQAVFDRPGPPGQPGVVTYPSGHATVAGAFAVTSTVIAAVYVPQWLGRVIAVQAVTVVLTMVSRVVLLEHYVTDVLGSLLGVTALSLLALALAPDRPVTTTPA